MLSTLYNSVRSKVYLNECISDLDYDGVNVDQISSVDKSFDDNSDKKKIACSLALEAFDVLVKELGDKNPLFTVLREFIFPAIYEMPTSVNDKEDSDKNLVHKH